jgi:hypothetical protein
MRDTRAISRSLALIVVAVGFGLAGCGDDGDPTQPPPTLQPPPVIIADLPVKFVHPGDHPVAAEASQVAADLLLSIWPEAGGAVAALYPTTRDNWSVNDAGCWTCTLDYRPWVPRRVLCRACPEGEDFAWGLRGQDLDETGAVISSRPLYRGGTTADGREGRFSRISTGDSSQVLISWTWTASAARDSVLWTFYLGPVDPLLEDATLAWRRDDAGTRHFVWIWPKDEKITFQLTADGAVSLQDARWSEEDSTWPLVHEMAWQGDHGTWTVYDPPGVPARQEVW